MSIWGLIKKILRPIYRILRKKMGFLTKYERKQRLIKKSYATFAALSKENDIADITFGNGNCVLTLKDERRYFFDPFDKVARMYSVPHTGSFEQKETNFLRGFIKAGQVCFDVGASFGWYTMLLGKLVGPTGHVHSFEPLPHTSDILQRNLSLNGFTNVTLNQVALNQTVGTRDLFLPDIGVSGSFRLHKYDKTYQTISCPTETLDAYCSDHEIDRVHFIKADIEGAEWPMLKGGTEVLNKSKPVLFLEIQAHSTKLFGYDPVDLFDWLDKLGYSPHVVSEDGNLVLLDDYRYRLPDHNFIFLPKKV